MGVGAADSEGAMAKLIKKKEVLIGKGSAPRMFDRVTVADDFADIYISPVDLGRIGTIVGIFKGGVECQVQFPQKSAHY